MIGLLVAPADYGGVGPLKVMMSWSERDDEIDAMDLSIALDEMTMPTSEPAEPTVEIPIEIPEVLVAPNSAKTSGSQSGDSKQAGDGKSSNGPQGSFFGIEAYGHEFVYIVDTSGSMKNRRFDRARAELIRSVNGLTEDQYFYVFLFGSTTFQMFDQEEERPQMIRATRDNKERLEKWLRGSAYKGGNTDPRGALRSSLKMNPSAIFMLSDGEFNGAKKNLSSNLFLGNRDAFSIVKANLSTSPIHAIAFEDKRSCANMQRLADMTNGSYRFTARDDAGAKEKFEAAMKLKQNGDSKGAERMLHTVIDSFPSSDSAFKARKMLADNVVAEAKKDLANGKVENISEKIESILNLDPNATVTADAQKEIVSQMLKIAKDQGELEYNEALGKLENLKTRFSQSPAIKAAALPLAEEQLTLARSLVKSDPVAAYKRFDEIAKMIGTSEGIQKCNEEKEQIAASVLEKARQTLKVEGTAKAADYLRSAMAKSKGLPLAGQATEMHADLAMEIMAKERDAIREKNGDALAKARAELQKAFEADPRFQILRQEFIVRESKARELLRSATRKSRMIDLQAALPMFERIVERYPFTLAAVKAKEQIINAKREVKDDTNDDLEMMLDSLLQ